MRKKLTSIQKARLIRCDGCALMTQGKRGIPACDVNVAKSACKNIVYCGEWEQENQADATAWLKEN